ncbi:NADH-ubiquinone oxidoreductase-F iron-sulfur binding region domain-containing protein [Candidatus Omnitrophota bacterium]
MNISLAGLEKKAVQQWQDLKTNKKALVLIGAATCGRSAGALELVELFNKELKRKKIKHNLVQTGCLGLCFAEPIVCIQKPNAPMICYGNVTELKAKQIIKSYLSGDDPVANYALGSLSGSKLANIKPLFEHPVLKPQVRRVLRHCGFIDPTEINHYIANQGYSGFIKAVNLGRDQTLEQIKISGLRGRGGAGFATWKKWNFCKISPAEQKYLICNADEGDPGAFMNRSLIEGDPHALIEGMLIAAFTIGANLGFLYCRAEYPLALERLNKAIADASQSGLLGEKILGTDFSFEIKVKEGAGAFVCGEETALIASIEGNRGMPRPRPPFPAVSGLWGKPTIINNVETLASVALIMQNGAKWFSEYGTENSKGTKTFALVGKVKNTGLIEVPLGISLKEIIYDIGAGVLNDKQFKAVQTGGPSGGCIPSDLLDLEVDYDSLTQAGSIMGSGGMVVMDQDNCMVDLARYFLEFTQKESCGKCVPCRLGTKQMLEILQDIVAGEGKLADIALLEEIGQTVKQTALCGLGQTAPNPVLTTIRYFRHEYEQHIKEKKCPAGVCTKLIHYQIDQAKCVGCAVCFKNCPNQAISGKKKKAHKILQKKCVKCGVCFEVCKFKAVRVK